MDQKYMAIILTNYLKNQGAHPKQNQNQQYDLICSGSPRQIDLVSF